SRSRNREEAHAFRVSKGDKGAQRTHQAHASAPEGVRMTETLFVCVPGDPVGKGRPRVRMMGGAGKKPIPMLYTPKETVEYEQRVAYEAGMSMRGAELFSGPVEMKLQIFMPIPASYTK